MSPIPLSIPCTFCHTTPSERNLTFANSPKSQKDPWTLSQIHHSYIFQTLGIPPTSDKGQLSLSFPSCANCVQDFQEIDKHFKTIANILKGVKKRCASEKERKVEEILGIESGPEPKEQQCASEVAGKGTKVKTFEEMLGIKSGPKSKEQRLASAVAEKEREAKTVDTVEEILGIKLEPEPVSEEEVDSWPLEDEGTSTAMPPPFSPQTQGNKDKKPSSSNFSCSICDAKLSSSRGLTLHMKFVHREKKSCKICGKSISFDWQLRHHRIEDHGVKTEGPIFPCPVAKCEKLFATERKLSYHQRVKHGDGVKKKENPQPFRCKECHETFSNRRSLKRHMTIHVPNEDFAVCPVCNKIVTTSCFPLHMMRTHPGDISERSRRECYFCQKTFKELQNLETHLRTHTRERPFVCPNKCGKDFTKFFYVQKHLKANRCKIQST